MTNKASSPSSNRLIVALPEMERAALCALCEPVALATGDVLSEPGAPMHYAYFPLSGFVVLETPLRAPLSLSVAMVGNEGMLGATLALGTRIAPLRARVQIGGHALRLGASQLQRELQAHRRLKRMIERYLFVLLTQAPIHAACCHFHEIGQRLACWLLLAQDRAGGRSFHLTHESLADMLGVHRSGVSIAAGLLQREGLIRYARGEIHLLDRQGLEGASCKCYADLLKGASRLFPTGKSEPPPLE
ncbi:Crp/Fnr family transcriptional regulator [Paludibacterium yongneupense]|uniref:Crp/Fnr family transcriptional regulator n=1 Tax=Paludibacterium yongneupense TaxID=400061 RepID=UPI0004904314|nr:Crp/Fnr family transcriptional regulator [Paludibacterium yongneupense]